MSSGQGERHKNRREQFQEFSKSRPVRRDGISADSSKGSVGRLFFPLSLSPFSGGISVQFAAHMYHRSKRGRWGNSRVPAHPEKKWNVEFIAQNIVRCRSGCCGGTIFPVQSLMVLKVIHTRTLERIF